MRRITLSTSLVFLLLASAGLGQIPRLDYADTGIGTGTFAAGLATATVTAAGSTATITIQGSPGAPTALAASFSPPPGQGTGPGGVPLGIDWTAFFFLWNGFIDPMAPSIGPGGLLSVSFGVPSGLTPGTTVHMQAIVGLPAPGGVGLTNAIQVTSAVVPTNIQVTPSSSHPLALTALGGVLLITGQASFTAFWNLHWPGSTVPLVNFTGNVVVAAFQGSSIASAGIQVNGGFVDPAGVLQVHTLATYSGVPLLPNFSPAHIVSFPFTGAVAGIQEHRTVLFAP